MRIVAVLILFVLAVAGFSVLAKYSHQDSVEEELVRLSQETLTKAGFEGITVEFDHLDGVVGGYVDKQEDKERLVTLLQSEIPTAYWPDDMVEQIQVRPTIPPKVVITRKNGSDTVRIDGFLANDEDANRMLLGARLHALDSIQSVENVIELDPHRLSLPKTAELASLAASLVSNSEKARIVYDKGELTLVGEVSNDGLKESLLELAAQMEPTSIDDQITVAEPVSLRSPSEMKLTRNRFGVLATGKLGSQASKSKFLGIFKQMAPPVRVTDRIEVSDLVSPAVWEDHSETIIPALLESFAGEMTAEFSHDSIRLSGAVENELKEQAVLSGFAPLKKKQPSLEIIADVTIENEGAASLSPPKIEATLEEDLLIVAGEVASTGFFQALEAASVEVRPELSVKNELTANSEVAPADWLAKLPEFFSEMVVRVKKGTFSLNENVLKLEGETVAASDGLILRNVAINTVPQTYSVESTLAHIDQPFPQPSLLPEVRVKLAETLKQNPVYFDKNSEIVRSDDRKKVEAIAKAIEETGASADLVVTGFADNVGNAEYNKQLSMRRANSVVEALVSLGLDREKIEIKSKGEDVSGVSQNQLWKSRRVEVSLAPLENTESEDADSEG